MPIKNKLEHFIEIFNNIIEVDDILSKNLFDNISSYLNIENIKVYFLSPNVLEEKYPSTHTTIKINTKISKDLFNEKVKQLDIISNKNHYITYLNVKGAVYGIILFEKYRFSKDDKTILKALTKILSYKIKDKELTEVINTQINALSKAVLNAKNEERFKTDFISNISHELRTPLNSILGFSELLTNPKTGELNQTQIKYINNIQISSLHLLEMINELLDISKLENGSNQIVKQHFDITQALNEVITILYPLFKEKNITLTQNIENIDINTDYQKIKQILFNLLSNAIKFTKDKIIIEIKKDKKSSNLRLIVKDNGIGIEKKNQKKIFKKFVQIKDTNLQKESSTGLGLTITSEFLKLLNGKITVDSEKNKGACFIITLPIE